MVLTRTIDFILSSMTFTLSISLLTKLDLGYPCWHSWGTVVPTQPFTGRGSYYKMLLKNGPAPLPPNALHGQVGSHIFSGNCVFETNFEYNRDCLLVFVLSTSAVVNPEIPRGQIRCRETQIQIYLERS